MSHLSFRLNEMNLSDEIPANAYFTVSDFSSYVVLQYRERVVRNFIAADKRFDRLVGVICTYRYWLSKICHHRRNIRSQRVCIQCIRSSVN